jgi:hypothetical protein
MRSTTFCLSAVLLVTSMVACTPVLYNQYTNTDITKPIVALHVEGADTIPVDVTNFVPGHLQNKNAIANPNATLKLLATATDNESGIKEIKLYVTRTVKYIASNGSLAEALMATRLVDSKSYTLNNGKAPSLGAIQITVKPSDEFVFTNASGTTTRGVGVMLVYSVEGTNFQGLSDYTEGLTIGSGLLQ